MPEIGRDGNLILIYYLNSKKCQDRFRECGHWSACVSFGPRRRVKGVYLPTALMILGINDESLY
jgi:hypothetical protein